MKKLLFLVLLTIMSSATHAQQVPQVKPIYMFGFAASFTDSVAYITDIQLIDSAYVYKNGFLADRTEYSRQLTAATERMGQNNMSCAVFFSPKKKTIEKKFLKVKQRYSQNNKLVITPLHKELFRFHSVKHINEVIQDVPATEPQQPLQSKK